LWIYLRFVDIILRSCNKVHNNESTRVFKQPSINRSLRPVLRNLQQICKRKMPGCKENSKANKWCKIRTCNLDNHFSNCTECSDVSIEECKKLNNTIGKVFKLIFGTDRIASLIYIKNNGAEHYAEKMCKMGQMAIKKGNKIF
jgi:hypothetical protein